MKEPFLSPTISVQERRGTTTSFHTPRPNSINESFQNEFRETSLILFYLRKSVPQSHIDPKQSIKMNSSLCNRIRSLYVSKTGIDATSTCLYLPFPGDKLKSLYVQILAHLLYDCLSNRKKKDRGLQLKLQHFLKEAKKRKNRSLRNTVLTFFDSLSCPLEYQLKMAGAMYIETDVWHCAVNLLE